MAFPGFYVGLLGGQHVLERTDLRQYNEGSLDPAVPSIYVTLP